MDTFMKEKSIRVRLSEKRYNKLKSCAESKEKTVTQLVEDWIDRLPSQKTGDSSSTPLPYQPRD
jgi:predicted DNA-binding ribbon-helix-helix protein